MININKVTRTGTHQRKSAGKGDPKGKWEKGFMGIMDVQAGTSEKHVQLALNVVSFWTSPCRFNLSLQ